MNGNDLRPMLEAAAAALNAAPKVSFSSTFVAGEDGGEQTASVVVTVQCHVDRGTRRAHMVVHESHDHASNLTEYYFDGDTQFVRAGGAWRRSTLGADASERLFARGGAFQLLNLPSVGTAQAATSNAGATTLRFQLDAGALRNIAPNAATELLVGDALLEVDLGGRGRSIDALRVETAAARDGGGRSTQSLDVRVRILSPGFQIHVPAHVVAGALPAGGEDLALAPESVFACWCTGCAACAACLACLACLSCLACIFPPLLAPVTATASGTAIAAAIAVSTSISTGVASSIQVGG